MNMVDALLKMMVKKSGLNKEKTSELTRSQILKELDSDTVQLLAVMPKKVTDSMWNALGVRDE